MSKDIWSGPAVRILYLQSGPVRLVWSEKYTQPGETTTHEDMTRNAILQATAIVLTEYSSSKNSDSQKVQQLIDSNSKFGVWKLVSSYYGSKYKINQGRIAWQFHRIIEYINDYNAVVDFVSGELSVAAAHFDSEQFESGQNRLWCFRKAISEEILQQNYYTARKYTGRMFHTLQDFYSHTNWIENWIDEGSTPYDSLGDFELKIERTADVSTKTCSDCTETACNSQYRTVPGFFFCPFSTCYECRDNLVSYLKEEKILTSGYYDGGKDDENNIITKPSGGGKCSHGGFIDKSSHVSPTGGINKDTTHPRLASHYYYHRQAANVAQEHTMQMLLRIRQDVNDDELFTRFLGINENQVSSISVTLVTLSKAFLLNIREIFSQSKDALKELSNTIEYYVVSLFEGKIYYTV